MINEDRKKLYDALSSEYDLGTYEEFERNIGDSVKRKKLYDVASADYDLGDFESYSQRIGPTHKESLDAFTAEHGSWLNDFEARDSAETKKMVASSRSGLYMPSENAISGEERKRYMELHKQEEALKKAWFTSDEYLAQKDADALFLSNVQKDLSRQRVEYAQANPPIKQEGLFQINPYAVRGVEADTELERFATASRLMDDAIKMHNAPSRYDDKNVFLKFGKGAGDVLSDADFWTAGLTEIADNLGVRDVLSTVQEKLGNLNDLSEEAIENILSPAEKAVLQAWAINTQEQLKRKDDLSRAYQAGQGATESLGFMAEFALTGGIGKAATEGVEQMAKWLGKKALTKVGGMTDDVAAKVLKETGEKIAQSTVGKYGVGLAESLAEAAGRTGVMPSTFRNISEKATEIETDENGNNYLVKMNNAFAKGYVDSFIENLSEGGRVNALGTLFGDVAGKIPAYKKMVDKFSHTKASELWDAFNSSGVMNTLRAGGWHGLGEEYLEEWYGNALRTLTGVDKEALKDFATVDNQIVTLTSFLPMTIFGGTVSTAQVLSANKDLEKKAAALKSALMERGYDEAQANNMIDMMRGAAPAEVSETLTPIVNSVANRNTNEAAALMKPVGEFAAAVQRWQSFNTKYNYQEQEQRDGLRAQMEENLGQFWQQDENGRQTVQRGVNEKGEVVYMLGKPSVEDVEAGVTSEVAAVTSDGRKVFVNPSEYQLEDELEMNTFLGNEIMAEKGNREQARMIEEKEAKIAEIRETAVPGTAVNIGTAEAPMQAIVLQRNPDGVIVNTPDGQTRQMTYEEFGNYVGVNAVPMTDAQIDEHEADVLTADRAQREAALDQEYENEDAALEELSEAEDEIEQAVDANTPLPMKADGSVDQTALWNNDPERWAQWNDEQRQDGGANSLAYINSAIAREQAKLAEIVSAYDAEPDFDTRSAMEAEIAVAQDRLNRLSALQQNYVPLVAQQDQEGISTEKVEKFKAEPKERERSVESEVARLYDLGLSDEEVSANLDAKVTKAQKALDVQSKKAPKMGADENAYITKKREHQQKMQELQQELDFATAARQAVMDILAQQTQIPDIPGVVAMEKDTEPQNAVEFAARELGLKDGGVKLQRQSFAEHTGYGPSEMKKFFGLFKSKQDGGLTIDQAGERLMELDRENNTGFFDQKDPNAGLNAILDAIGAVNTIGELRSYVARQRQAEAQREADAAYSAMMAEYEATYGETMEESAYYDEVMRSEILINGLSENEQQELNNIIFAEEISQNGTEGYQTEASGVYGSETGSNATDVEPGTEGVYTGGNGILQETQSDNSGRDAESQESQRRPEGEGSEQDALPSVPSGESTTAVESSLDEDMPDFTSSASAYFPNEEMRQKFSAMRARINEWAQKLGVQVRIMETLDDVVNQSAREQILKGGKVYGYFDPATGEVAFYLPDFLSLQGRELTEKGFLSEIDKTYIHEVVAHRGLRGLLGEEKYGELCDMVWDAMTEQQRVKFLNYPGVNGNSRTAADEFIAHFAENVDYNDNRTLWDKIVDFIKDFFNSVELPAGISNESLAELLRHSYRNLAKSAAAIDTNANLQAEGNTVLRAANGSLVGLHNISEDKLRKVLKQGGLANPSTAVVNISEYLLDGYGEISLIMPSSLVDASTGDNIGTYTGDAWTPTYPPISRKVDDRGWEIIKDRIRAAIGEESELYSDIVHGVDNYLDDNHSSKMEFVFLKEKGIEPEIAYKGADGFVGIRNLEAILGVQGLRDGLESYERYKNASPMAKRSFNMWLDAAGNKQSHRELKEQLKKEPKLADVLKLNEDVAFADFDSFTYNIFRKDQDAGKIDTYDTMGAAARYVDANNLRGEFEAWLESLMEQAGAKEVFFAGYTRDGERIYKDNTLENVSRHMRLQGRRNAYDDHGLSATKSALLQRLTSLSQIRKNRARLQNEATYNKEYDALKDRLWSIISQLADMQEISSNQFINVDYAESRLQEAITKRNPIAHLNKEYGYDIDPAGEYADEIKSFIKDVQQMPAKYFETKFERPVYLNEFAAAVMPTTTSEDIKLAISEAGLPIFEYDSSVEGSRKEATLKATEGEGIRFRAIGEKGAANLDKAEEATIRLDNLAVARQMEKSGKDAKAIKLATGWERGVDKLWRYEVPDDFDLTELENRLQKNLNDGLSKTWGVLYPSDLGDLAKAYPDFNVDIMVWVGDEFENTGEYSPATEGDETTFGRSASIEVKAKTVADIKDVLVHEIQHAIQEKEGFAEGGSVFGLKDKLSAELDKRVARIKELREEGRDAEADELMSMSKGLAEAVINNDADTYQNYRKLAGEVEARNVSARLGMSEQERRESLLSETEDVAREDQIVLMDGLGVREVGTNMFRTRITPEQDAAYLKAVEDGDMETAQRMVMEAAKLAMPNTKVMDKKGNPAIVYHGTKGKFNTFAYSREDIGFHFGTKGTARTRIGRGKDARIMQVFLNLENPLIFDTDLGSWDADYIVKDLLKKEMMSYDDAKAILLTPNGYKRNSVSALVDLRQWMSNNGYDGIVYPNWYESNGKDSYIAFSRPQIKSADPVTYDNAGNVIPLSERFNGEKEDIRFRASNENQAIFVSNAARAVEGIKQEKATPEQWLKMIEKAGGLKAGEDKWMGLSDWLKASDKKTLTKQEVLDFINENMIVIDEQHYSEDENALDGKRQEIQEALQGIFDEYVAESEDMNDDMFMKTHYDYAIQKLADELGYTAFNAPFINNNAIVELDFYEYDLDTLHELSNRLGLEKYDGTRDINDTRLSYTTEGLTDRHEIALTVPTIEPWDERDEVHFGDAGEGRAVAWIRFGDTQITEEGSLMEYEPKNDVESEIKNYIEMGMNRWGYSFEECVGYAYNQITDAPQESVGWTDEAVTSVADGMRGTARVRKVLVIDEIQSKRHQEGRERGYISKEKERELKEKFEKAKERFFALDESLREKYGSDFVNAESNDEYMEILSPEDYREYMNAQMDFSDARLEMNNPRYDAVPDAPFDKNWHELAMKRMLRYAAENGYDVVAWTKGEQQAERYNIGKVIDAIYYGNLNDNKIVRLTLYGADNQVAEVDSEGRVVAVHSGNMIKEGMSLAEIVGKEIALKIMNNEGEKVGEDDYKLSGEGLRVGGEGMKGFYDRMLPAFMNKYGKKWGVKVEDIDLSHLESGLTMHSIPVTEEMKASVMEGQVMFRTIPMTKEVQDEMDVISATAIVRGNYLKAPNGADTNLTPEQWALVRTKAFKAWFGDWEKAARIQKLRNSEDASINGNEIAPADSLDKKAALEYGKKLQGFYTNKDTGASIQLQRGRKNGGVNEVLQHNYKDAEHLQSIAAIPQIIEKSIFIESVPNADIEKNPNVVEYQHFVCGLKIGGEDYTVHSLVAVDKKGDRYYDHNLTAIEKKKLLDLIESQAVEGEDFGTTPGTQPTILSTYKGKQLVSLLQVDASKVVDENGEPKVVFHGSNWRPILEEPGKATFKMRSGLMGRGAYFTDNFTNAADYAREKYEWENYKEVDEDFVYDNGYITEAFLNIRNEDNIREYYGETYYLVTDPSQIKSATDNTGEFSEDADIRFRMRGENESAKEFTDSIVKDFKDDYNAVAPIEIVDLNTKEDVARFFNIPAEDITDDDIQFIKNDVEKKDIWAAYHPDLKKIVIFVRDSLADSKKGELALIHENIHAINGKYPEFLALGEYLWNRVEEGTKEHKYKTAIQKFYPEHKWHDELSAYVVSEHMQNGTLDELRYILDLEHTNILNKILNTSGYGKERKSDRASFFRNVLRKRSSGKVGRASEKKGGASELTAEERRIIGEYFPEFNKSEDVRYRMSDVNTNPTEAQKKAGNYKMGHIRLDGYNITIENPKGSIRRGTDSKGNAWENTLNNDYGYIRGTEGVDGDHIDVYLSDNPAEGNVFVIDQVNPETREFDEHKVMYGFSSAEEAREAYLANFSEGWNGLGTITEVSKDEFKKWIESSHRKTKPFSEYKSVRANEMQATDESELRYRVVSDQETLDRLNSEPTIKVYRAMQLIDGKLYPPMSAKVDGELRQPIELGQWEEAEERPDLVDEKGRFKLDKGNKSSLKARYNPYFHTSPTPLNDQFSSAQTRPELVTVEVEVPESELTSGYKAEKAKDSVGKMEWKAGVVQSKLSGTRIVILSRWDKPVRIVPDSEVADVIVGMFEGRDITMPSNVVTPSLRAELEKRGVPFVETDNQGNPVEEVSFRTTGTPTDEVVANGLQLTPAQTAEVAASIFAALPEESRKKITEGLNGNVLGLKDAILQIPTSLATKENWSEDDRAMADVVAEEMTKMAGEMTRPFSASEGLWLLYNNLNKGTDLISQASRALVQRNLGFDAETLAKQEQAKEDVRFRTVGDATSNAQASLYNRGAANVWTRLEEVFVDMQASVGELVKAIEKRTGKVAQGFENILLALNQQSSKGLAAMESYTQRFLNPMFDEIRRIMDETNMKYEDIVRYVILKHGLERNKKLAQRDARAHYQEIYDDIISKITGMTAAQKRTYLTNAQLKEADAKAELATLQAVDMSAMTDEEKREHKKKLAAARKAIEETEEHLKRAQKIASLSEQEAQDELDKIFEKIENGTDSVFKEMRENDYSGISSMFYDQLGVDRKSFSTEEQYQAALMEAKKDRYSSLKDIEAAAEAEVKSFEGKADTKELWKRINAATKETLRQQYEANMISKDQYLNLRDMFEYYVPLRGFKDNTAEDMYTYYRKPNSTGYTKPILGAEGRKTEAESPFGWIAAMAGSAIASNVKNEAKLALYYFVSNRPENGIATISKTWFEFSHTDPDTGKKVYKPAYPPFSESLSSDAAKASYEQWQKDMEQKRAAGQAYEAGQRLNLGNAVVNISDANKPEHIVNVKVGGKDYTIIINGNPRAAQAINGDLNIETNDTYNNVLLGPWLRWLSSVNTSYNPEFWATNMMRDVAFTIMAVSIKGDAAYQRKFFNNYRKAFKVVSMVAKNEKGTLGNSYIENKYKDFVKYGGVTGYTQIKDSETWEKEIENYLKSQNAETTKAIRAVKDGLHAFHRFGESLEQVSRFAAFLTAVETGKSINEAINDAKEITVNFNRKGSGKRITIKEAKLLTKNNGQRLNDIEAAIVSGISFLAPIARSTIMFFNASVQALNAWFKLWKANKLRSLSWVIGYAAIGVMNALIHALLDDDDEYLDIPQYERRSSLMLGGNGVYFKWALPQEMSVFYALGELSVEAILGRNPHQSFAAEAAKVIGDVLPVNIAKIILEKGGWVEAMPSQIKAPLELLRNEDYKGDVIFNDQKWLSEGERERTANWESAYKGTGRPYIEISRLLNNLTDNKDLDEAGWINIHPGALEHVVESMTGGVGRTVSKLFNFITATINPEEDVTVKQTPFLNRFLTINDERFKNVHVNDVFDYYKADAEHALTLEKQYIKDRDMDSLTELRSSDEYRWAKIYGKYKKPLKAIQDKIKVADGTVEKKELMKRQDELKKRMIKEISEL